MKAMILAAGLGTRLHPYTENKPKALVELNGKPLLQHVVEKLYRSGVRKIIVNVHHFPEQIDRFIGTLHYDGLEIRISDESSGLLDTGGGIANARAFLDGGEPFIVHNTDIISEVELDTMENFHRQHSSLATLAVCDRPSNRLLWFDEHKVLCGWEDTRTGERIISRENAVLAQKLAFSGIHILDPSFFRLNRLQGKFSIIRAYLQLAATHDICGYEHSPEGFFDLGDPGKLESAKSYLSAKAR